MTQATRRRDAMQEPFERVRAFVDARGRDDASFNDVVALAEIAADSMQSFFQTIDCKIYAELREISDYITNMRAEITLLRVGEMKSDRLPKAGEHLGAIVIATEEATNAIMEAAEAMLGAGHLDEKAYKALVNDKVMAIFEACSFQDLTGQRIARVIETLEHIEAKIGRFAAAVKTGAGEPEQETERERRARELLLNGPQNRGIAIAQNEVDALFD